MERFGSRTAAAHPRAVVEVVRHPRRPRVYVAGWRVHHGSFGAAAAAAGAAIGSIEMALIGALLVADDWRDFPWRDTDNH